ncbi:MAG: FHA domain-containing protein, partial [Verrucomicrobiae bacterium]|nr:FHA domain-containing protein [Verrucomicrobiae bacterium]
MSLFHFKIEPLGEPPLFLELSDGRYLIGRGPECEVCIDHDGISRRHALLVIEDERVWVEDLFSSNGTSIDGESVG